MDRLGWSVHQAAGIVVALSFMTLGVVEWVGLVDPFLACVVHQ
jgi:ABC-type Fe3+-siderophore transport system permease subunit